MLSLLIFSNDNSPFNVSFKDFLIDFNILIYKLFIIQNNFIIYYINFFVIVSKEKHLYF